LAQGQGVGFGWFLWHVARQQWVERCLAMTIRTEDGEVFILPPLPMPDYWLRRQESTTGCGLVVVMVAMCITATEFGVRQMSSSMPEAVLFAGRSVVFAAAAFAFYCLCGLMFADPGTLLRTERTCLPVPSTVAEKLRAREPPPYLVDNITNDKHVYCVRCLMWRVPNPPCEEDFCTRVDCCSKEVNRIHHCSTCQRCVEHFDHHCGVFGRCIAGRGVGGNMGYFKGIIAACNVGSVVSISCLLGGLRQFGTVGSWIVTIVVGYFGLYFVVIAVGWTVWKFWNYGVERGIIARPHWRSVPGGDLDDVDELAPGAVIGRSDSDLDVTVDDDT